MAFIIESTGVVSFAEYEDVLAQDQRLFDSNEGLTDTVIEEACIKATNRILARISATSWWRNYYMKRDTSSNYVTLADIPEVNPDFVVGRKDQFTELCVCTALSEYILPGYADFGDENSSERAKMGYYQNRAESLFEELIIVGDWYDFNEDSTVSSDEKDPGYINLRRVR